ncbi:YkvA family protein [Methanobacterium sp. BAmetb5]|uniref:YkvA family protein n=1 Tax=Methanobacterium sp. BAmetb5 TaxID=2025351 RepID=UPI000E8A1588|nr:YkvA family protein [Methanobacterium sp. BAmetb5]AXV39098.1 MAG: hypothetical protein CIT02_01595 [Methanobacterium sp. BAmetb5]
MENQFKDYFDVLSDNLASYDGDYASFIDHGPTLYKLLTDVLDEKSISNDIRLEISAAIAYYVIPMDIIPEQIYGPYGYIDDIFISSYVIKKISNSLGYEILEKYWIGTENLQSVVEECYNRSIEVLENKTDDILKYVGLI